MKKIIGIILLLVAFAFTADYKPFTFDNIPNNDSAQQAQFDYMLQYKLYGYEYLKIGQNDTIPDKSGWNGSATLIDMKHGDVLGGPILTPGSITVGNGANLSTGPVRGSSFTMGNDNNSVFAGHWCIDNGLNTEITNIITRSNGVVSCESVQDAPLNLQMPTIVFPENTDSNIVVLDREKKYIDIPDTTNFDLYINSITTGTEDTLFFRMKNKGTLTRIFVKGSISFGNHTVVQVVYASPEGDSIISQDKFRGNLLFYTQEDFNIRNTDYSKLQGTYISTKKINLISNIDFAGQLLANQLEIGDNFSGKNFRFVKFDPDTLDFPELNKQGGLKENDLTVIIPISLSDTATIDVYFTYCFELKDGVTVEDFNMPPYLPICGDSAVSTKIPIGSKTPLDTIKINVKVDDLTEPNDILVMKIDSITGAVLPNGETSGELKIKIIDADINNNYPIEILTANTDSIPEDAVIRTKCGEVKATDGNDVAIKYTITDTSEFKIDSITGEITSNTLLDYETKKDYQITVHIISADSSTKDTILDIHVKDVNESVHVRDTIFSINEDTTGVLGTITAWDDDGPRDTIKFTLSDTINYSIDSNGKLTLVNPFDFETKEADTITVYVNTKNGDKDSAKVIINIKDVNEPPVLQPNDTLKVPENCDTCFVGIITAIDPDKNDTLSYSVEEPGFKIDSTGKLTTTKPFDHETTPTVTITVVVKDKADNKDTLKYVITITNVNEPVHVDDKTCTIKENYVGNVCQIPATDEDNDNITYTVIDNPNYEFKDDTLVIKNPIDYEKKTKDTVKVIVTDGDVFDTATVVINIIDEKEDVKITDVDHEPKKDTIKTNDPNHNIEWKLCEGTKCDYDTLDVVVKKDTTIKVCNEKKTVCDSVVILFNDAPPVVTLTNAKSTDALIDYITIEEQKDNKIYVNKKDNELTVTVRDTIKKTEKTFPINVKLDTLHVSSKNVVEYNYLIDETLATITSIGGNKYEKKEVIKVDGREVVITEIVDKNGKPLDSVQTITYTVKQDGKDLVISYKTDNLTGQRLTDYTVSYQIDSNTTVSYFLDDNKKIAKNEEGNIAYTIEYEYTDDFGNKATSKVEIIFDNIPPKVEILNPTPMETFNTNAIPVKWTVNGDVQDTLTLQRLEKGVNYIIRRYVDKAGNVAADTITVIMREAKDIDISLVHPVTKVDQDKVDEYYSEGHKYNDKKPYDVKFVDPKNDSLPEVIGVGFKVDIVLPSVSPTGSLATLDDIVKNGMIPVDDKGNIVGASTKGIPVETYVSEHCTDEFMEDYKKNGLNIPLYDVTYNLHLWVYTNNANYVNDFNIEFTLNDEAKTTSAGTVQMVIDWLSDKDGNVKAKNGHALGTGAYITKLWSKSIAKHRCDYKEQKKGDRTVKKDDTMKVFGYKRPNDK